MFERLSKTEERELIALGQAGDVSARNKVIEGIIPFIYTKALRVSRITECEKDELVAVAVIRMIRMFNSFNPNLGYRASTYFGKVAEKEMWAWTKVDRVIRIPQNAFNADTTKPYALRATKCLSLSGLVTDGDENPRMIADGRDHYSETIRRDSIRFLHDAVGLLGEKQQSVVAMRLEGAGYEEIAEEMGFSRQRAHQVYKQAVERLRLILSEDAA